MAWQESCPCGSGTSYDACCGRLHRGTAHAATAAELMRSRYAAYAVGDDDYVFRTWHPRTRPDDVSTDPGLAWTGLEVLGSGEDWVEFAASYTLHGRRGPDAGAEQVRAARGSLGVRRRRGLVTRPVIRERRTTDLPALARVLAEQQAATRYPVRWPLPVPVEDFLVRPNEERAWVAEVDGRVVGHVAVLRLEGDLREPFIAGTGTDALGELAVLFVAGDVVGTGVGGRLHDTAVDWIVASGRQPVLDVVPLHDRAVEVYRHRGWRTVGEVRPVWLAEDFPTLVLMTLDPAGP